MVYIIPVEVMLLLTFLLIAAQPTNSSAQANELNGKHLVITTSTIAPYVYIDHNENGEILQVRGFVNELVLWLAAKYNFTFHYVEPTDGFYGSFVNNSWNGMIRMLIDNKADMIAFSLTPTYPRSLVIDFVTPFAIDPMAALIPPPNQESKILAVVHPFKLEVWVLIIASMLCVALITWTTINLTSRYFTERKTNAADLKFTKHILVAFGVISCQGQYLPQHVSHSTRIAAASWCLTSVVLVYLYSGCLISFMTVPKFRPLVETLDELADHKELQIATLDTHFFQSMLLDAKSGTYKKLGDEIRKNPQNSFIREYVKEPWKLVDKATTGRFVALIEKTFVLSAIESYLKNTGKCSMSVMKEEFYPSRESFAVPKGRSYAKLMDQGTNIMRDTGFIHYWEAGLTRINKCTAPTSNKKRTLPRLKLTDLDGAFVLLFCGIVFSFITYILELIFFAVTKQGK